MYITKNGETVLRNNEVRNYTAKLKRGHLMSIPFQKLAMKTKACIHAKKKNKDIVGFKNWWATY